jgi:prophage regulatory protein
VAEVVPISRSTAWRLERAGKFPRRRKISPKCVGWLRTEVEEWARSLDQVSEGSLRATRQASPSNQGVGATLSRPRKQRMSKAAV